MDLNLVKILVNENFHELLSINRFNFAFFTLGMFHDLLQCTNQIILSHVISNADNLEAMNDCKWRPIHCFVFSNSNLMAVELLLNTGVQVNVKSDGGNCPIHYACANNNVDIVKLLHKAGANINIKNKYNSTPISIAVKNKCFAVVQYLLENNVDVESPDYTQRKPIHYACKIGLNMIKLLVNGHIFSGPITKSRPKIDIECLIKEPSLLDSELGSDIKEYIEKKIAINNQSFFSTYPLSKYSNYDLDIIYHL